MLVCDGASNLGQTELVSVSGFLRRRCQRVLLARDETIAFPFCVGSRGGFLCRSTMAQVPDSCQHLIPLLSWSWALIPIYAHFYINILGNNGHKPLLVWRRFIATFFCLFFFVRKAREVSLCERNFVSPVSTLGSHNLCRLPFFG